MERRADEAAAGAPDPGRWARCKELVADALDLPQQERAAFVDAACGSDAALRERVLALVAAESASGGFLETPALGLDGLDLADSAFADLELEGRRIGRFRVLRRIGEGGMGVVYLAEEDHPRRRVALKLLRQGLFSADARRRFRHEVEILGRIDDPAVARIHEAGIDAASGLPYFAMELVEGRSITEAARELGLEQRVELFARVCDGVQAAHRQGVIHRDLKPDNVLVDAAGRPRILDFGIARATDADLQLTTIGTRAGELVGTLPYMSPEQVAGDARAIDLRADVYALGVMLYELLAGRRPLDLATASIPAAVRAIQEQDPPRLGRIDPRLAGDLEAIAATALEKDPRRRYASASELAADLRRFLAHQPVAARPPSARYQLAKLARRHRALFAAAGSSVLLLVAAIVGTSIGLLRATAANREARYERDAAREAAAVAERVNESLHVLLASVEPERLGGRDAVRSVLDGWARDVEGSLEQRPLVRASLNASVGWTYYNLELYAEGERHLALAAELFERELGPAARESLRARERRAQALIYMERAGEAERIAAEALRLARDSFGAKDELALDLLGTRALALQSDGRAEEALALFDEALATRVELAGDDDLNALTLRNNYAVALADAGRFDEAAAQYRHARARLLALHGADFGRTLTATSNLAELYDSRGRFAESLPLHRELCDAGERAWGSDAPRTLAARDALATALVRLGQADEALAVAAESFARALAARGASDEATLRAAHARDVALLELERFDEALPSCRAQLERCEAALGTADPRTWSALENLASALAGLGRHAEAEPHSERALALLEERFGAEDPRTLGPRNNHARLLQDLGRLEEAAALFARNLELAERAQPGAPLNDLYFRYNLGRALAALGRREEAEVELLRAHATASGAGHAERLAAARSALAELYAAWDRPDEAARWR